MNKQDIQYERTITSSYMKIPSLERENLDVRILLQRSLKGLIPVERCFINGQGQYWYNISGKQALDSYIKINTLKYEVFELLILRICEQLEILEWNLLETNGLLMDPEYIFLNNKGNEISFVFYPHIKTDICEELQKLLEYLLSKINHTDKECVQKVYDIYELFQSEGCQIQDLKYAVLKDRMERKKEEPVALESLKVLEDVDTCGQEVSVEVKRVHLQEQMENKISYFCKRVKELFIRHPKEEIPTVVYPEDEEEQTEAVCHPTICIAATLGKPRGILLYEGIGDYPDFELHQTVCMVGKSPSVCLQIQRETISNIHAKIEYTDGYSIEDMNSTNGTFVNDELLNYREKRALNSGDVIRFADVKYRFL